MKRCAPRLATWIAVLFVAAIASADGRPTLHEYVPDLGAEEGMMLVSSGGAQPAALVYQGEVLPAPEGGARQAGERALRSRGEQSQEGPSFRPDRVTSLNGTVGYYTVFTPGITPFKRVTALDAVALAEDGTPVLVLGSPERERIEVLGASAQASEVRDRFWGSVVLEVSGGGRIPFPTVAADARLLTVRTEPLVALRFERDGADNLYASLVGATSAGEVRVVFLMDAPRAYFGRPLPEGARADALAARVHPLPPSVRRDAETFAGELGLSRSTDFAAALRTLAGHFRAFEESDSPPADSGNIYLDLARGMRGICRHRVYAFVITAQALGMHARFVHNEAHAWAEVELPGGGWLRVDLGGAATGLDPRSVGRRPMYRPDVPDPLPKPAAYQRAYEQARRMSAGGGAGDGESDGAGWTDAPADPDAPDGDAPAGPEAVASSSGPAEAGSARRALELVVDRRAFEVFRGRELEVTGVARSDRGGVSGLRVEVLLRAERGDAEWLLGVTVTRDAGLFRGVFGVPPDLAVGDYRLVVRTPGDDEHAPARAM